MPKNTSNQSIHKRSNRIKLLIPIVVIFVAPFAMFFYVKSVDAPDKSQVDGMSDEVYEELVQFYFMVTRVMDTYIDESTVEFEWIEDQDLYEEAEAYKEKHDVTHVTEVFPNPLLYEYNNDKEAYSDIEQAYIEKMVDYLDTLQRVEVEEYRVLKKELKNDLDIKDSYNPFDER